jgi:lipoate-protein ligase A
MLLLELTLSTGPENLALDEALLEGAEAAGEAREVLRLWEPGECLAIVGRSSRLDAEVNRQACAADRVPVLRRTSGGAAIVAGPGCLMYSVILSFDLRPELKDVSQAHRYVLGKLIKAIAPHVANVACHGTSDLVIGDRKFSGNSLRLRRRHLLYHGTLLYSFPLELIPRYLVMPPRMPDYRERRPHEDFVTRLPMDAATLRSEVIDAWQATEVMAEWPEEEMRRLAAEKYSQAWWNEQME